MDQWIVESWASVGWIAIVAPAIYVGTIIYVRIVGIRSIADMEAFDFATTVAIGTILAGTAVGSTTLLRGLTATAALLGAQTLIGLARVWWRADRVVDNPPVLLVRNGMVDEAALRRVRMTHADLAGQLRRKGVWRLDDAALVLLETTGAVSVLQPGDGPADPRIMPDVVDVAESGTESAT